jgi:hypothetical protein
MLQLLPQSDGKYAQITAINLSSSTMGGLHENENPYYSHGLPGEQRQVKIDPSALDRTHYENITMYSMKNLTLVSMRKITV